MSKKVSLARIDKRLLHATVTLNWDPFIRVDYVAVVGSEYKNDPFTASVSSQDDESKDPEGRGTDGVP